MSSFIPSASREFAALQAQVTTYTHPATGARHVHFATEDTEFAFLVGFPTLPTISDGRAHVLEHLLLCGSQRYPVRDPFFSMMNRSLATFMNAMTYADMTVYPFATIDRADFFNLMDVYLDATFFPRLDRLDFLQEGWRAEVQDGQVALHGVVLNEMKAKMSEPGYALYRGLSQALLPDSTYAVNSGGDPLVIPQLTHQALVDFHRAHYHPSQAVFMTWGRLDPVAVQARLEQQVLSRWQDRQPVVRVARPAPWTGTRRTTVTLPAGAHSEREHRLQLGWRLGPVSDLAALARAELLQSVLLDAGGGLLRQAIEAAGFGRLSDFSGLDSGSTEILFHVGMAGLDKTQFDAAHTTIREALQHIAQHPDPAPLLRDSLRQLRFADRQAQRGFQRLIGLAQTAVRHEDMLAALDTEAALRGLAAEIEHPDFLAVQIQTLLHDTPCLVAEVHPDPQAVAQREEAGRRWTEAYSAGLSEADRQALVTQAEVLAAHQKTPPPAGATDVLPRIALGDVDPLPRPLLTLDGPRWQDRALSLPTGGLSHAWIKVGASVLPEADWPWLDLYAALLPQLGAAGMGHEEAAHWRRARVAQLHAACEVVEVAEAEPQIEFTLRADALREDQAHIPKVLAAWLTKPLLDPARLRYLIGNRIQQRVSSLGQSAASMAALDARAGLSGAARFRHMVSGLPSLDFLATLQAQLATADGLQAIVTALSRIHSFLLEEPRVLLCAGMADDAAPLLSALQTVMAETPVPSMCVPARHAAAAPASAPAAPERALLLPAQVNACVAVWPVPTLPHPDAPALAVLAELLQNQLLHPKLREQGGAYGAQASYAPASGTFILQSMADPRVAGTFADMLDSLQEMQQRSWTAADLEQAILGVVRRLDPTPVGAAQVEMAWTMARQGLTPELRQHLRRGVLGCTLGQVLAAAASHLPPSAMRRSASVGWADQALAGLQLLDLQQHCAALGLGTSASH